MSEEPVGERLARLEGKITELNRQQSANWQRSDEHEKALAEMKIQHVQAVAKIEADLAHLERDSLRENFGIKTQIAEIGWRVGLIVGAALLILNFVVSKVDFGDWFSAPQTKGRINGR